MSMNTKVVNLLEHSKIFFAAVGISWPFLFGGLTGATQFGLKIPYEQSPLTYVIISGISVIIGIVAVIIEHKKTEEKEIAQPFRNFSNYVKACSKIHESYSRIMILAKTPGLILPSERDLDDDRKKYFEIIRKKLKEGKSHYQLQYLFDIDGFRSVLTNYVLKNEQEKIDLTRKMIEESLTLDNLDLRYAKTDTLGSVIIGSDVVACVGLREKDTTKVAEGIRIHATEIVRVLKPQYDILFNKSNKVDNMFFDNILSEIKESKKQ